MIYSFKFSNSNIKKTLKFQNLKFYLKVKILNETCFKPSRIVYFTKAFNELAKSQESKISCSKLFTISKLRPTKAPKVNKQKCQHKKRQSQTRKLRLKLFPK